VADYTLAGSTADLAAATFEEKPDMKIRGVHAALLLVLFAPAALAEMKVDFDPEVDFSKFETYDWREGTPAARPYAQGWIEKAIDGQLQDGGLKRVDDEGASLHVRTIAFGEMEVLSNASYNVSPTWGVGVLRYDVRDVTTGSLLVELVDPETGQAVWRGWTSEQFDRSNDAKIQNKIKQIVKRMFRKFPPKKK